MTDTPQSPSPSPVTLQVGEVRLPVGPDGTIDMSQVPGGLPGLLFDFKLGEVKVLIENNVAPPDHPPSDPEE
jgi:hypothetical protein